MKSASSWLVAMAVALTLLALQGCAGGGALKYASGAAPGSTASPASSKVITGITNEMSFEAVRAAVAKEMSTGGRFASVDSTGRATVDAHFTDMASLFKEYGSVDKMTPGVMARIDNDQNAINGVLAAHDGNRLICHEEIPVGTHFPTRVCRTLSEIQNERSNARRAIELHTLQGATQKTGGDGGGGGR